MNKRIKELRSALNLTQDEFSAFLHVTRNTVACYESGRRSPSDPVLALMCQKFSVNADWLLYGSGPMFTETAPNEQLAGFLGMVAALPDDDCRKQYIRALSKLSMEEWEVITKISSFMEK